MQLKSEISNEPRAKFHMRRKFNKAAKYASLLRRICNEKSDEKTKLEAEAYASWMSGNLLLEKEKWGKALLQFGKARTILEQLAKVGDTEFQERCRQRLDEIEPSVRYCNYNLKGTKGLDEIHKFEEDKNISDLLKSKLEVTENFFKPF